MFEAFDCGLCGAHPQRRGPRSFRPRRSASSLPTRLIPETLQLDEMAASLNMDVVGFSAPEYCR